MRLARETEPDEPLLRGDELGIPPGPLIGELLDLVAEEIHADRRAVARGEDIDDAAAAGEVYLLVSGLPVRLK